MMINRGITLKTPRDKRVCLFLVIFALVFARYCYYGFSYFHQLDDYIQYYSYTHSGNSLTELINELGLLAARPLAGIADIVVWSKFFGAMIAAVAIISALFAASACLFRSVWSRHFGTGHLFLAVYTLLPLGIEGTYWVSASSRVVVGLFFASLALWLFDRWCGGGGRRHLALFAVTQLIAFAFYEQAIALSAMSVILLAALYGRARLKRGAWFALSFVNAAVYFGFTSMFKTGSMYAARLGVVNPLRADFWSLAVPNVSKQVTSAFLGGGFYTLAKGAWRGAQMLVSDMNLIYIALILALCAALFFLVRREKPALDKPASALVVGVLMAVAPVALFFVINNPWFSLRCTVMSFPGIALIADTVLTLAVKRVKRGGVCLAALAALFALVCCAASVSEMHDYRQTTLNDQEIMALIADKLEEDGNIAPEKKIAVLNIEPSYLTNQNYYYHEHIHGVTESGWALTGALREHAGKKVASVTPMAKNPMYRPWNHDSLRLSNFDAVYIYLDGRVIMLELRRAGELEYLLYDLSGVYMGRVWEEDMYGYLELT